MKGLPTPHSSRRLLCLSNGHGEDLNATLVLAALRHKDPSIEILGLPLVGAGKAYSQLGIPLIAPTRTLPSGGFIYMNTWHLLSDLVAGLPRLLWQQFQAVRTIGSTCTLAVAVGDIVPLLMAHLTRQPYAAFLVSTSSYYEGTIRLPWLTWWLLRHSRCRRVWTRDVYTAQDLQRRGLGKAHCAGYPIMDAIIQSDQEVGMHPGIPHIALFPGSRVPEALHNLALLLEVCRAAAQVGRPKQYWVALVGSITKEAVGTLGAQQGWSQDATGSLVDPISGCRVRCCWGSFGAIVSHCDLVLGMAGTAVEQAVGLGKPVLQLAGQGPQFTYRFAEAQMRLLGPSVQTFRTVTETAQAIEKVLGDPHYLEQCRHSGQERVGNPGGSDGIAFEILDVFSDLMSKDLVF